MNYISETTQTDQADQPAHWVPAVREGGPRADILLRFKFDGTRPLFVGAMDTGDAMDTAGRLTREKAVLADALLACDRYMEYMAYHTAYLSGQIAEEEYIVASAEFSVAPRESIEQLADRIAVILRATKRDFSPEKLEEFCSATSRDVEAALRLLANRGMVAIEE